MISCACRCILLGCPNDPAVDPLTKKRIMHCEQHAFLNGRREYAGRHGGGQTAVVDTSMLPEEWEGKRKRRQAGPVDSVVVALTGRRTVSGRNGSSAL